MSTDIRIQTAMLVGEIQALAYMVNTFTEYAVFVDFSGHVDAIMVSIRESKENYNKRIVEGRSYVPPFDEDWKVSLEEMSSALNKIKSNLRKILRKNAIPYSRMNFDIEEVRRYKLT